MTADFKPFLRLQTDDFLTSLRDKVWEDLFANRLETSFALNGKSGGQQVHVPVADLAQQLAEVLEMRGLVPEDYEPTPRMTLARFC